MIEVLKPGLISSFQDLGRWGHQPLGVPVSGAMDELSHRLANLAVANDEHEATLELTMLGPGLRFERDAVIAWGGADLSPALDGTAVPPLTATAVPAGATLQFGRRVTGLRAYLAVQGGYAIAPVMGSASTYARAGFGGHEGRLLRKGDRIALQSNAAPHVPPPLPAGVLRALRVQESAVPDAAIRVLRGREWEQFDAQAQQLLLAQTWRIGAQSDRMGYRLEGAIALERAVRGDILSEPVSFGTMQVPPDGQPIVLMAERQTTGGYPKVAQVASVDLPRLAQRAPGESVRFAMIELAEAQALLLERERALQAIRDRR
ncbi:MAG TPA: biotin-dependent carboxyltransferase family protein [Burkholderiaceae bacterium]|nr:biotin-dependent carboxyltransferase family protein [Burkholderiaceae bacterium]